MGNRTVKLCLLLGIALSCYALTSVNAEEVEAEMVDAEEEPAVEVEEGEEHAFQAETNRLMDIIVHSMYSNREIFLRELISNAADASDKLRMLKLNEGITMDDLDIKVHWDEEAKTISISDKGIGMTRDDLITNLGTIAKSGTSSFLEKYKDETTDEGTLIGQFGVGFYSSFLVATRVSVTSKHESDVEHSWSSTADGTYTIAEVEDSETERGTTVKLHLREDAEEFLNYETLEKLIKKYSAYIDFPIYLVNFQEKQFEVEGDDDEGTEVKYDDDDDEDEEEDYEDADLDQAEAEDSDEEEAAPEEDEDEDEDEDVTAEDDDIEVDSEEGDEEDGEPKKKTVTRKIPEWKHVNDQKPLWRRDPDEIEAGEYATFYESIRKGSGESLTSTHFKAEGEVDFKALLYIPDRPQYDLYDANDLAAKDAIKLYVRKVLLKAHFENGLLPRYLGFVIGVVDSDDLPINISRETLQETKALELIRKKLVRKVLEMIRGLVKDDEKLAEEKKTEEENAAEESPDAAEDATEGTAEEDSAEEKAEEDSEGEEAEETAEEETKEEPEEFKYTKFWKKYGTSIKLGCVEDRVNQKRLIQLMRFKSSRTNLTDEDAWVSLEEYVGRMVDGQENIYYLTGNTLEAVSNSPFLERMKDKDYEVLYLYEPIDEYWTQQYTDHEGIKLMSLSKDNFAFSKKDEKKMKKRMEEARKGVKPLNERIKELLGAKIERVKLSNRLRSVPMMISTDRMGYTANMELVSRAQSFTDPMAAKDLDSQASKKVVELNPYHPLIRRLVDLVNEETESSDKEVETLVRVLYDTALVSSGFHVFDSSEYAERMSRLIAQSLDLNYEELQEELKEKSEEDMRLAKEDVRLEEEEAARKQAEADAEAEAAGEDEGGDDYDEYNEGDEDGKEINLEDIEGLDADMMEQLRQAQRDADAKKDEL